MRTSHPYRSWAAKTPRATKPAEAATLQAARARPCPVASAQRWPTSPATTTARARNRGCSHDHEWSTTAPDRRGDRWGPGLGLAGGIRPAPGRRTGPRGSPPRPVPGLAHARGHRLLDRIDDGDARPGAIAGRSPGEKSWTRPARIAFSCICVCHSSMSAKRFGADVLHEPLRARAPSSRSLRLHVLGRAHALRALRGDDQRRRRAPGCRAARPCPSPSGSRSCRAGSRRRW